MAEPAQDDLSDREKAAIHMALDRVLASRAFEQSRRRRDFLAFVVGETLAGRGDRLKGYTIGREVFDRPESFDPNIDPIVRMEAGRLRDRLREYYETEGASEPIRIELAKGSYTPHFITRKQAGSPPAPLPESPSERDLATPLQPAPDQSVPSAGLPPPARTRLERRPGSAFVVAFLILLVAAGAWIAQRPKLPVTSPGTSAAEPSEPVIAVLPFLNLSGDPAQDYFSDGLTEDLLTSLARVRDLKVLARNTTFQFKGKAVDVKKLGQDLAARYILEGSARRTGDDLRVTAQLIDATTGAHVWAERYDRNMADVALVEDEIVDNIVGRIAGSYGAIEMSEARRAARKSPDEVRAYDLVLRAREIMQWDWTPENFEAAGSALRQAIALDHENGKAYRELAWLGIVGWVFGLDAKPEPAADITARAIRAVQLDPDDARGRMVAAAGFFFSKDLDPFRSEADKAIALAPHDAEIIATIGCMLSSAGDRARGVALAEKAHAINADASIGWYHSTVYTAAYLAGDMKRALEVANDNQDLEVFYSYVEIIPIYGQLGMKKEARVAWGKLLKLVPDASAATFESWWRLWNISDDELSKLMYGVRLSGVLDPVQSARP